MNAEEDAEEGPAETGAPRQSVGVASIVAGLAFVYALVVTLVLLVLEGLFADAGNQRTILVWLLLPIVASFLGWIAVSSPNQYLKLGVWLMVLAVLFFCWLAIFSIGLYFLPVAILMVISVLGPWDHGSASRSGGTQ